jgi:hypothetical protein
MVMGLSHERSVISRVLVLTLLLQATLSLFACHAEFPGLSGATHSTSTDFCLIDVVIGNSIRGSGSPLPGTPTHDPQTKCPVCLSGACHAQAIEAPRDRLPLLLAAREDFALEHHRAPHSPVLRGLHSRDPPFSVHV